MSHWSTSIVRPFLWVWANQKILPNQINLIDMFTGVPTVQKVTQRKGCIRGTYFKQIHSNNNRWVDQTKTARGLVVHIWCLLGTVLVIMNRWLLILYLMGVSLQGRWLYSIFELGIVSTRYSALCILGRSPVGMSPSEFLSTRYTGISNGMVSTM